MYTYIHIYKYVYTLIAITLKSAPTLNMKVSKLPTTSRNSSVTTLYE